jgi:hypothetical protein
MGSHHSQSFLFATETKIPTIEHAHRAHQEPGLRAARTDE